MRRLAAVSVVLLLLVPVIVVATPPVGATLQAWMDQTDVRLGILEGKVEELQSRVEQLERIPTVPPTTTTLAPSTTTVPTTTTTIISPIAADVVLTPGDNIQAAVDSNPAGTTFLLKTGVYTRQQISSKSGNVFIGEPGTVLDGEGVTRYAFLGGSGVTIQGLIIENYNNPAEGGAVSVNADWKVLNNEIRFNAGAGISLTGAFVIDGNYIHHNEQIGIVSSGAVNAQVINNEIAFNNPNLVYDMGWEAGGTKFVNSTNLYVAFNYVHDNFGAGLWTDINNYLTVYEENTVENNYGPGIFHEISYDAVIRNNTVTGNAHQFYVGGILVANSSNVEVYGNTLSGNNGGVVGLQDDRGSGNRGVWDTTGLNVHDNTIEWSTGFHGVTVNSGLDVTQGGTIVFTGNTYTTTQAQPFRWGTQNLTLVEWQTLGFQ